MVNMSDPSGPQVQTNPGVRVPPPLIYLAYFLLGVILDRFLPLPSFASFWVRFVGWLVAVGALVVVSLAIKEFRIARTTVRPDRPASALITGGIFARSRNPLYLSLLMLYGGVGIYHGWWWPIIISPLLVLTMNRWIIAKEENYLTARFGDSYLEYCRRVRRWV